MRTPIFLPIDQLKGRTIGRIFIKIGLVNREEIHTCLQLQKESCPKILKLGQILLDLEMITEDHLKFGLNAQKGKGI